MNIYATIKKIDYTPYLGTKLKEYPASQLRIAMKSSTSFALDLGLSNKFAVSWWVSAKRSRSYPYARVYNTLSFTGRKVTIIPVYKDEGADGDRDFLQWDTLSLMSLLGVYVIIGHYETAERNPNYANKITNQVYDYEYIERKIEELKSFQSDALHWNLLQADEIGDMATQALTAYQNISRNLGVAMHSPASAKSRILKIADGSAQFKGLSRVHALAAQKRELVTLQPKEHINMGDKSTITINNYLGGEYYFTTDEAWIDKDTVYLAECKHSKSAVLPSNDDIKDGLIKMILYSNIDQVTIGGKAYKHIPMLKLTSSVRLDDNLHGNANAMVLEREANHNGFVVRFS